VFFFFFFKKNELSFVSNDVFVGFMKCYHAPYKLIFTCWKLRL